MLQRLTRLLAVTALLLAVPGPGGAAAAAVVVNQAPAQAVPSVGAGLGAAASVPLLSPGLDAGLRADPGLGLAPAADIPQWQAAPGGEAAVAAAVPAEAAAVPRQAAERAPLSPFLSPADAGSGQAAPTAAFLAQPQRLAIPSVEAANAPAGSLREGAQAQIDRILCSPAANRSEAEPVPSGAVWGAPRGHLSGWFEEHFDTLFGAPQAEREVRPGEPPSPPAAARRGWLRRATDRVGSFFKVLSDPQGNRSFWLYTIGQVLLSAGMDFHYSALNGLVSGNDENSPRVTYNRSVNWAGQAVSTLLTGPYLDRASVRRTLVWTYLVRGLLLVPIPVLFIYGYYTFAVFQVIMFASAFLQSMSGTASSMAFTRILGKDSAAYDKANAILAVTTSFAGVIGPLLAGSFIGGMDKLFGVEFIGNALSYGVYAVCLVSLALLYWMLHVPADDMMRTRRALVQLLKGRDVPGHRVRGVGADLVEGVPTLVVEVEGEPKAAAGIPESFAGYKVKRVPVRGAMKELLAGFGLNWKNRFLRRTLLLSTLDAMAGDALIFAVLYIYIKEILVNGASLPAWLAAIPALGPFLAGFLTPVGAFCLFRSALALGEWIPSLVMALRPRPAAEPGAPGPGKFDRLERKATVTSILYGAGAMAFAAAFFIPSLWVSAAMMLLSALLQAPAQVVWGSVHQKVMAENFPDTMGKVFSARNFYYVLCYIAGLLLFGGLIAWMPTAAVIWVAALVQAGLAVKHTIEPFLVFPLEHRAPPPSTPSGGNIL